LLIDCLAQTFKEEGPFKERFLSIKCQHNVDNLSEERIIATLWGCIKRRFQMKATYAGETDITINYNHFKGMFYWNFSDQTRAKEEEEIKIFKEGWAMHGTEKPPEINKLKENKPFPETANKERIENNIKNIFMHIDEEAFKNKEKLLGD
jgi:hypothetical protein